MDALYYIFFLIIALGVLITFHEAGHFLVARWTGVHVVRFCVGFGKPFLTWRDRCGTEFCIAPLPLGGYLRMYDQRDPDAASHAPPDPALAHRSYDRLKPQWRIAIALGGPGANFVLAIALYWAAAVIGVTAVVPTIGAVAEDSPAMRAGLRGGEEIVAVDGKATADWADVALALAARLGETGVIEVEAQRDGRRTSHAIAIDHWHAGATDPDPIGSLGIDFAPLAVIGGVRDGEPAMRAGLRAKDRITHVDGDPIVLWDEFAARVRANPGESLRLTVERADEGEIAADRWRSDEMRITPATRVGDDGAEYGYVGAAAGMLTHVVRYGVVDAVSRAVAETWATTALTVNLLGKMITGRVSPTNIAGPITIAKAAGDSARAGIGRFLSLLALISISLGVINLLPIPVLDGGLVVLNAVELVRRKPVSAWAESMGARVGIVLVAGMMVLAFYNDITRWLWPGL